MFLTSSISPEFGMGGGEDNEGGVGGGGIHVLFAIKFFGIPNL